MADGELRDLATIELPFGRRAILREVTFDSGLRMVRLVLREGTRITQIDMDEAAARALAEALTDAAASPADELLPSATDNRTLTGAETDPGAVGTGAVWLVGAGPGDPDLLTVGALRLMQRADVVLYDRLVGDDIMALVRRDARRVYVGKLPQEHTMPQEDISKLMVRLARDGNRVLRLKGGDPYIFGRGGEEIEELAAAGIAFQVVPGITAASGSGTYAGIPLTHRDHAQSCLFVTAHGRDGVLDLDWEVMIRKGQTVAIYMGLSTLPALIEGFERHGVDMTTPVAVIQNGTRPDQRVITATLSDVADRVQDAGLQSPCMILIGSVVTLRDRLNWHPSGGPAKPE
jgi:uroporphyrin-III C-methyltransferase/precorrin-2 dehydrogenase/sirohydrochlorin ferrochelatase